MEQSDHYSKYIFCLTCISEALVNKLVHLTARAFKVWEVRRLCRLPDLISIQHFQINELAYESNNLKLVANLITVMLVLVESLKPEAGKAADLCPEFYNVRFNYQIWPEWIYCFYLCQKKITNFFFKLLMHLKKN